MGTATEKAEAQGVAAADIMGAFLAEQMEKLAGDIITGDEVEFHDSPKIVLPKGFTYSKAQQVLERIKKEQETETLFNRVFDYRPDDGAYAASQVIKQLYGLSMGKVQQNFFGVIPAQTKNIKIGPRETLQVPWGLIEVPTMPGLELYLMETESPEWGLVFQLYGKGPKKYQSEMDRLFDAVATYLETNSIYRGRAIFGGNHPEFLDLESFKPDQVIFSDEVTSILEGTIWGPIRYSESMRSEGVQIKRSCLLHGPYGTGKTSIGMLTALEATKHDFTYIAARPGKDKPEDVLKTARLYQPAVVFVEDIDIATSSGEDEDVTRFLDAFDGIVSKGGDIIAVMTTNHISKIHKGMLRPGRLDAVIEVAELDRHGVERLVKAIVDPSKLAGNVNYDEVFAAMEGFLPAFIRESVTRSIQFSITRLGGETSYTIDTPDLVGAANSLRSQYDLLNNANEGKVKPTLDSAFREVVRNAVVGLQTFDPDYDESYPITEPEA